jgi:hypothetical protein
VTAAVCAGPGCDLPLTGQQTRFCGDKCRKAAHRDRVRAERQTPERRNAAATNPRRPRPDPERVAAEATEYARALRAEAECDLERHPERRRYAKAADPDVHRRRVRRQPWRGTP